MLDVPLTAETAWLYGVFYDAASAANRRHFGLILTGIERDPSYLEQLPGREATPWRRGYCRADSSLCCKLTIICQLSDRRHGDGGDLQLFDNGVVSLSQARGSIFVLLGTVPWRLTQLTRGVRRLVL